VRALKWKAPQLIAYAASLKADSVHLTDLGTLERTDDAYLTDVRKQAEDAGVRIYLGSWSLCPGAKSFKNTWGTAEEHGALLLRLAKALGSPNARVILGNGDDRKGPGGIQARIDETVAVCQALKGRCEETGVKLALENHAGDLLASELVDLIERAGKGHVGANLDTGNSVWTMEDPLRALATLGPYVLATSVRDSMVWESPKGATVQWTALGDGVLDLPAFFDLYERTCPHAPVHIETIGGFNREIPYLDPEFMALWPRLGASDLARFIALARKGKELPTGKGQFASDAEFQKFQLERSLTHGREVLGLGMKG
jgi:sugar phosphate isomerase/epimerase